MQPQEITSDEDKSSSDIVHDLAEMIRSKIQLKIDPKQCNPEHLKRDSAGRLPSLTIVLLQEVDRYNKLLIKIHKSIEDLERAIKGLVVMSEELENVFIALINNQVLLQLLFFLFINILKNNIFSKNLYKYF